ncbi:hypothetical protein MKW92_031985 [Papaver armeniacum]|nr:hypothetical protein MKW92_031985 [Papaver armeniacum]
MEDDVDIGEDISGVCSFVFSFMLVLPVSVHPYCNLVNCIDSIVPAEAVFAQEVKKLQHDQFNPSEQVTLEPFESDHACVVGG